MLITIIMMMMMWIMMMVMVLMMMTTVVIMFLNNNGQLHVSILEQEEVEAMDQEDNKHRQITPSLSPHTLLEVRE